jgi:hypothetical protein
MKNTNYDAAVCTTFFALFSLYEYAKITAQLIFYSIISLDFCA